MWKPTKKQHLTNKKYVDENGGSGGVFVATFYENEGIVKCSVEPTEIETAIEHGAIVVGQLKGVIGDVGQLKGVIGDVDHKGNVLTARPKPNSGGKYKGNALSFKGVQTKSNLGGKYRECFVFSAAPDILDDGVYAISIWFDKETGECFMLQDKYPSEGSLG